MKPHILLVYFICILNLGKLIADESAWNLGEHLGTKSPYPHPELTANTAVPAECTLTHIHFVARHGARNPTKGDVTDFDALESKFKSNPSIIDAILNYHPASDAEWIRSWKNPFSIFHSGFLSKTGDYQLYEIAKRLKSEFSTLISEDYSPTLYSVVATQLERTSRSANSFVYGLFEGTGHLGEYKYQPFWIHTVEKTNDQILRFFQNCKEYNEQLKRAKHTENEAKKFEDQILASKGGIKDRFLKKLKLNDDDLTFSEILTIYRACVFEYTLSQNEKHWCSLFDEEDHLDMEYYADLKTYWTRSYGLPISYEISSILLQEMVKKMDQKIADTKKNVPEKAKLMFAHAETMMPFISLFGLYNDSKPLLYNYTMEERNQRLWRVSKISPFAANFHLALYNCSGEFKVKAYHNEREVILPQCGQLLCPYSKFKEIYKHFLEIKFENICGMSKSSIWWNEIGWIEASYVITTLLLMILVKKYFM